MRKKVFSRIILIVLVSILQLLSLVNLTYSAGTPVKPFDDAVDYDYAPDDDLQPPGGWVYGGTYGPQYWGKYYSTCGSVTRQSPVNLDPSVAVLDDQLDEISLVNTPSMKKNSISMINNGHTAVVSFDDSAIRISGGNLGSTYRVSSVHFHWGGTDAKGSEHTIQDEQQAAEMHIVSYDEGRFDSVAEALVGPNSIAVLAVLFTVSTQDNPALQPIVDQLSQIQVEDASATVCKSPCKAVQLARLLPSNTRSYYRYLGSLTTPPCSEVVVWTVFSSFQTISSAQLAKFRSLQQEQLKSNDTNVSIRYLTHNWRPVQALGNRVIRSSCLKCGTRSNMTSGQNTIVRELPNLYLCASVYFLFRRLLASYI